VCRPVGIKKELFDMANANRCLLASIRAAIEAGIGILDVYTSADFKVEEKADKSPLTHADRRSHEIIVRCLEPFDIPILSEEGKDIPYAKRHQWDTYWLIDPLDGTKEFIKKNGEFTVNIAMIRNSKPVAGVVCVPDKDTLYFASKDIGAYKADVGPIAGVFQRQAAADDRLLALSDRAAGQMIRELTALAARLPINRSIPRPFTIVGSRSHASPELVQIVEEKRREHGAVEFISAGSSLKLCLVAEGRADLYPRTGPTMEWDTAAGQAVVEISGGKVYKFDTQEPLEYNKENLLNPWFVVVR
jgi:3'(2'), 5'-bisphosphate nucleotidase